MKMQTLRDLLVDELKDLYSAENQIIKALPKMAKAASSDELRSAFEEHLEQTHQHSERLERICELLDVTPKGKKCVGLEGIIEEGKDLMSQNVEPAVLDAGLIAGAQKVEHYEMAGYGCARTWARQLGIEEAAQLLEATLDEEKATDQKLNQLAEHAINQQADQESGPEGIKAVHGDGAARGARGREQHATR
jgi:ferritin-like metal-binding protein YciE